MKCKFLLSVGLLFSTLLLSVGTLSGENLKIKYQLQDKHGVDLSVFPKGPLKLDDIQDGRSEFTGKQINEDLTLSSTVATLVTEAIRQGYKQGGATLVKADAIQSFGGEVTELSLEENSGEIQATVRAKLHLKSATSSKTFWQSSVFGRASVNESEGPEAAIAKALDKLVVSLFVDDYFLIELID